MCGVCAPVGRLAPALPARRASAVPGGGVPALSPAYPATVVPTGGGVPALPPAYTAFSFVFLPLSPRPPSRREGGDFLFSYARGCAPCIPGAEPARHWFALPLWKTQWGGLPRRCRCGGCQRCPAGGVPALSPAYTATVEPAEGRACFAACLPCHCGARGKACPLCRLPTLPLALFSFPYPPSPLPDGKGVTIGLFCRGLPPPAPRH